MAAQSFHLAWYNPVEVAWGVGSFQRLSYKVPVVVLADRVALSPNDESRLSGRLSTHSLGLHWFGGGLATVGLAERLAAEIWPLLRQFPDAEVLAIGGGSTMDLAKVLRYRMDDDPMPSTHWRNNTQPPSTVRHALTLVPTTAGTGSEVTRWATLWDTKASDPRKISWAPECGFADRAVIDPCLTLTCPERITRDCALDTLAHALESLWNVKATPLSELCALEAARIVLQSLDGLLDHLDDIRYRTDLSRASWLAGLAMSQTQTAIAHALSYDLTLREGLPHGEACAVWLEMAWDLSASNSEVAAQRLFKVFDLPPAQGLQKLHRWLHALGIEPRDLRATPAGRIRLNAELQSARGQNFVVRTVAA